MGAYAVALPVGETMLAARSPRPRDLSCLWGRSDSRPRSGRLDGVERSGAARFTGDLRGVPWGTHAQTLVAVVAQGGERYVVSLPRDAAYAVQRHCNLAGEPRDTLRFEAAPASMARHRPAVDVHDFCALLRVGQISGALEAVLAYSIRYVKERTQFGRPIAEFQAVQHQLALLGEEAAAVNCAARAAYRAAERADAAFEIAAAKLRANLAIGAATAIAHQVHGAIGFTREYALRCFTQRLWSWRTEFGNDRYWSERLGAAVAARGAEAFWADLTGREEGAHA